MESEHIIPPSRVTASISIHHYFVCNIQTTDSDNQKTIPELYLPPWFVEPTTFLLTLVKRFSLMHIINLIILI